MTTLWSWFYRATRAGATLFVVLASLAAFALVFSMGCNGLAGRVLFGALAVCWGYLVTAYVRVNSINPPERKCHAASLD